MNTKYEFKTSGTCASKITYELDEFLHVHNVVFTGGCNGNLKAIAKLVEGHPAAEIANLLRGNTCGFKSTSCASQLACALDRHIGN